VGLLLFFPLDRDSSHHSDGFVLREHVQASHWLRYCYCSLYSGVARSRGEVEVEQGLMFHQTHYRSHRGRVFTGQMTQPTVSKHRRKRAEVWDMVTVPLLLLHYLLSSLSLVLVLLELFHYPYIQVTHKSS